MDLRLHAEHRERDPERKQERDGQKDVDGRMLDLVRNLPVESPPHERLVDLVDCKEERRGCEGQLMAFTDVAKRIDTNGTDHNSRDQIGLGGEAHYRSSGPGCTSVQAFPDRPERCHPRVSMKSSGG